MRHPTFDLDVLRTFVAGVELGSFAKAAERLGRSTSAVSAQLKKLESQVGSPVLLKSGRGLTLSPAGESLLSHARRLLELNDEIFSSLQDARIEGTVRIGLQDDFAEHLLSDVLRRFSKFHPRVSLEVSIARNSELLTMIENAHLDLALAWEAGASTPHATRLGETRMHWIGSRELPVAFPTHDAPLPLVVFDAPCILRTTATKTLDQARIPWRVALTSPSVSGIWAAVSAGLGITLRTRIGLPAHLAVIERLPALPMLGYVLHQAVETPTAAVRQLSALIQASLVERR